MHPNNVFHTPFPIKFPVSLVTLPPNLLNRNFNILRRIQLLMSPQIHGLLQQRHNVRIKRLPIRVLEVVFLTRFIRKPLYDSESPRIMNILHDEPIDRFLVLAVDACGFDELGFDAGDGVREVVCVEVDG